MELFAIQPYVPLAAVSEFSKPLANDKLVITLFGHATPLPLVVRHSDFQERIFRRTGAITRPRTPDAAAIWSFRSIRTTNS